MQVLQMYNSAYPNRAEREYWTAYQHAQPHTAPELEHTETLNLYQPERDSYADVNAVYFRASALTEKN